ncbi:MAG: hypothetical protein FRX49_02430 [Trebouxia sp. A1-2]|nr:MAG: hypothetical protein FRX49_02430 [Trebouxia sp. A1-2]
MGAFSEASSRHHFSHSSLFFSMSFASVPYACSSSSNIITPGAEDGAASAAGLQHNSTATVAKDIGHSMSITMTSETLRKRQAHWSGSGLLRADALLAVTEMDSPSHTQSASDLLELDSEVSVLNDELRLGLLKIWTLLVDNKGQQLVLQTTLSDSEVDKGGLSLDLRGVVRVAQLGVEDQSEVLVVLHLLVSQLDIQATSLYQSGLLFDSKITWVAAHQLNSSHKVGLTT